MKRKTKPKSKLSKISTPGLALLCSVMLLMSAAGYVLLSNASAASAAVSCVAPYSVAKTPTVSTKPSTTIGVIGQRAPAPGAQPWDGDDRVNDMVLIGNTMYAAGEFDSYIWNGATYPRHNIVAFDATTGAPTAFAPSVDGEVLTITASCTGSLVYLGGNFHTVDGQVRNYAAKVNIADSTLAAWNPNPSGTVEDIEMLRNHLVVTGSFSTIGGASRSDMASLNQTSGVADSWLNIPVTGSDPAGPHKILRISGNHAGTTAVMIGNFNTVGGVTHRRVAVLQLTDTKANLYPWNTTLTASNNNANYGTDCSADFANPERDVAWTPDDTRFITISTGGPHYAAGGTLCDSATSWDASAVTNTNAKPVKQQYTGGDTLSAGVCTNDSCFLSGHNRYANNPPLSPAVYEAVCDPAASPKTSGNAGYDCMGPTALYRQAIMQVSVSTMQATAWNPGRSRQIAMHNVMLFSPQGLWLGSDGDNAGGVARNDLVLFPFQ